MVNSKTSFCRLLVLKKCGKYYLITAQQHQHHLLCQSLFCGQCASHFFITYPTVYNVHMTVKVQLA